jgi:hypothetical protein
MLWKWAIALLFSKHFTFNHWYITSESPDRFQWYLPQLSIDTPSMHLPNFKSIGVYNQYICSFENKFHEIFQPENNTFSTFTESLPPKYQSGVPWVFSWYIIVTLWTIFRKIGVYYIFLYQIMSFSNQIFAKKYENFWK